MTAEAYHPGSMHTMTSTKALATGRSQEPRSMDPTEEAQDPLVDEKDAIVSDEDHDEDKNYSNNQVPIKDDSDDEDDGPEHQIIYDPLTDLITSSVRAADPSQPPPDAPITDFNNYWRNIFTSIREIVASRADVPTYLFDPPKRTVQVGYTSPPNEDEYCCPCDLPYGVPELTVELSTGRGMSEGKGEGEIEGVTADLFMEKLAEALYGKNDGSGKTIGGHEDRLIVNRFESMRQGSRDGEKRTIEMGPLYVFLDGLGAVEEK